ncbi:MAG: HD domain-containing protein [Prevotella sp.]
MDKRLTALMRAMIRYDAGDARRIQHLVKVHDFAATIAAAEGMGQEERLTLEAAAILHDVGIHAAERKYGNCSGKHQEELGPAEALRVMGETGGFTAAQKERICWLIAHHHTYTDVTTADHRILLEADFLVNSFEDNLSAKAIKAFRDNVFHSPSAISMLNDMWALEDRRNPDEGTPLP